MFYDINDIIDLLCRKQACGGDIGKILRRPIATGALPLTARCRWNVSRISVPSKYNTSPYPLREMNVHR